MSEICWYVVHTYSGYENKVKVDIEKTIENRNLHDQILEVRVPTEDVVEVRDDGTRKQVTRKLFPGYVFLNMIMNDETWYVIRNTRGVTGFVGPGSKPVPLSESELSALGVSAADKVEVDFAVGDVITVVSGAWEGDEAIIRAVNESKQTVTINLDMFGRETPVELNFTEVKKM